MTKGIEDASDHFVCLPSASDIEILNECFAAVGGVYEKAWYACEMLCALDAQPTNEFLDSHDESIDPEKIFSDGVTADHCDRARGLGPNVDEVFWFYVRKAIADHRGGISPFKSNDPYQPWFHIGFPLPIENVTIETTDDGLDWIRFGSIGPVAFGFTGPVPSRVHTVCFKRTDDLSGYEVVFVGEQVDVADGAML